MSKRGGSMGNGGVYSPGMVLSPKSYWPFVKKKMFQRSVNFIMSTMQFWMAIEFEMIEYSNTELPT